MPYFFAALAARIVAPLGRSLIGLLVLAAVLFYALSLPVALWKRFIDATPSQATVETISYVVLGVLAVLAAYADFRRWKRRREDRMLYRELRREMLSEIKARRAARR